LAICTMLPARIRPRLSSSSSSWRLVIPRVLPAEEDRPCEVGLAAAAAACRRGTVNWVVAGGSYHPSLPARRSRVSVLRQLVCSNGFCLSVCPKLPPTYPEPHGRAQAGGHEAVDGAGVGHADASHCVRICLCEGGAVRVNSAWARGGLRTDPAASRIEGVRGLCVGGSSRLGGGLSSRFEVGGCSELREW
jgi:hypothetical protein